MKRWLVLVAALAPLGGCARDPESAVPLALPTPLAERPSADAAAELDQMDTRSPVPLLPRMAAHQKESMRDHLLAVQEIAAALAVDDFPGVEKAVSRIGSSEEMGRMCSHMGRGAPGFTEQALGFHLAADRIAEAARKRDRARVLTELTATLQTCTACHAVWKQQVVDEAAWKKLTSSEPPVHGAP